MLFSAGLKVPLWELDAIVKTVSAGLSKIDYKTFASSVTKFSNLKDKRQRQDKLGKESREERKARLKTQLGSTEGKEKRETKNCD